MIGRIKPRAATEISGSSWSVGAETLDRDYANYANYKQYVGALGAKAMRLQAGWAKCEPKPGVYNFGWLDSIVDDALSQGVQPWLELSYGNPIYPIGGGTGLGGSLPRSPEALQAWDRWVQAIVLHFGKRVKAWEIWNESDNAKDVPFEEYANFFIRTAEAVREENPAAQIYALGLANKAEYADAFLGVIKARGKLGLIDAITFHSYPHNPDDIAIVTSLRGIIAKLPHPIPLREGENGAPSLTGGFGALKGFSWSEVTQTKWDLRRLLMFRSLDIPMNLFTFIDLKYPTGLNSKGLIKANPDETAAYRKQVYYSAQNVFSVFDDTLSLIKDFRAEVSSKQPIALTGYQKSGSGGQVVAFWLKGAPPAETNETSKVDLTFGNGHFTDPVYVDLRLGTVYRIPRDHWKALPEGTVFTDMPIYDSPALIAEASTILLK